MNGSARTRLGSALLTTARGLRNHRRIGAAAAAVVGCGLVALPVVALTGSTKGRSALVFTSQPSATTTLPAAAVPSLQQASAAETGSATTVAPQTQPAASPIAVPQSTTSTTALVCHNSYNPVCGAFSWSRTPAAAGPVMVNITPSPANPIAGQTVSFTVTYSDPNAQVNTACATVDSGSGLNSGCTPDYAPCKTRYGPWDPPAKQASSGSVTYPSFTYSTAGSYTFSVKYPAGDPCYNPYAGEVTKSISFDVGTAPSTTTSTSA